MLDRLPASFAIAAAALSFPGCSPQAELSGTRAAVAGPPVLADHITLGRAMGITVRREDDTVAFQIYAEQMFSSDAPDVMEAELEAPAVVRLAVVFPDQVFLPLVFTRDAEARYVVSAFDGEEHPAPTEAFEDPTSLGNFAFGTLLFAMENPNFIHAVADQWRFDLGEIRAVLPVIQPQPPWNEGWSEQCYTGDFECSDQGPIVVPERITIEWDEWVGFFEFEPRSVTIDWTDCCLVHDRAFYCGGDLAAFMDANATLAGCVADRIQGSGAPLLQRGPASEFWWSYFFFGTTVGNAVTAFPGWPWAGSERFAARQQTCLCGGDQPVPLCDLPCEVNTCEAAEPLRLAPQSWQNLCVPTCEWSCVQREEDFAWEPTMCIYNSDGSRSNCAVSTCDPGTPPPTEACEPG